MARLSLWIEVDEHEHSPTAHRAVMAQLLGQIAGAISSTSDITGAITKPPGGAEPARQVGVWNIGRSFEIPEKKESVHV